MLFPETFAWGSATSAFQIEGTGSDSGAGRSIWDAYCDEPGRVFNGDHGRVACDHYHRFREDVALMREIGLNAYRFSISWPRVLPGGTGEVNRRGLDFYDQLVDELLAAGIQPWITLFHWDYPQELHYRGGWLHPDSPYWFEEYTRVVADRLSDRVTDWMTFNEQQVTVTLGYRHTIKAPGVILGDKDVFLINHRIQLAHGLAVQAIRSSAKAKPRVGIAPVGVIKAPKTESPDDIEAARQATFSVPFEHFWCNTPYYDPVILGTWPEELYPLLPDNVEMDLGTICQPLDFLGSNIYHADLVESDGQGGWRDARFPPGQGRTTMGWNVVPESLYWGPRLLHERYGLPIVVTENGMAGTDWVTADGKVHDPARIDFTRRYLKELRRGIREGLPVLGYFHWSTLDNFEWEHGYSQRFGLIHVNFQTQKRTLKDSAFWYGDVIRTRGSSL